MNAGIADAALRMTATYLSNRTQFGKPLATFQAVAQRAADAFIKVEGMRWTAWQAVWRLSQGQAAPEDVAVAVLGRRRRPLHHLRRPAPARRHGPRPRLPRAPLLSVVEGHRAVPGQSQPAPGQAGGGDGADGGVPDLELAVRAPSAAPGRCSSSPRCSARRAATRTRSLPKDPRRRAFDSLPAAGQAGAPMAQAPTDSRPAMLFRLPDALPAPRRAAMTALLGAAAFGATMLGGAVALRLRDRLHLILGFSAGAVVAVAFFDLLPEAFEHAGDHHDATTVASFVALGFLLYLLLDRLLLLGHGHADERAHDHHARGRIRAGSLSLHSFLDGVGIGLAFQVSAPVGVLVGVAILAHDFSDGINTVNVIVRHGGDARAALRWLLLDATAPLLGVLTTTLFTVPPEAMALLLATFAGFFLYLGAADLIPESHHAHPTFWTTFMTLVGAAALYVAIRVAG
ncbi:MAG: ZIP family metal transporter [Candidatus Binatia bacterium]